MKVHVSIKIKALFYSVMDIFHIKISFGDVRGNPEIYITCPKSIRTICSIIWQDQVRSFGFIGMYMFDNER